MGAPNQESTHALGIDAHAGCSERAVISSVIPAGAGWTPAGP